MERKKIEKKREKKISVILSTHAERFSVSCMQDF